MIDVIGHRGQLQGFANAVCKGRLSGSFLFIGPPGVGKTKVAIAIAKTLLCLEADGGPLSACGKCESCIQVEADTHPDVIQVRKPDDRAYIPLELLIGPADSRMQEGFCRDIRLRPFRGTRKIGILHDADYLNEEGANCLLKTLEEPPPDSVLFLIGTNEQRQLPTIRSRCRIVRFAPPSGDDAIELMHRHGIECDQQAAAQAIELCGGDCVAAASLLSGEGDTFRQDLNQQLKSRPMPVVALAANVSNYVDEAGKEAPQRRDRLRDVLSMATAAFRDELKKEVDKRNQIEVIVYQIERTIEAITQIQRNANQATLIESWSADVARGRPA